ncbi:MAG: phosphoglycerate kinase [Bacilli bacterium]
MDRTMKLSTIKNKKVLLRVDYNVPMKNNKVQDKTRITESIPTITELLNNENSIIILSHMGKITKEKDKKETSLYPVYLILKTIFDKVYFSYETTGNELTKKASSLNKGEILLIENTRYEDIHNNRESLCSASLSSYWARLADVFVFDAFASIHRNHASTYGITKILPSYMGFLVKKELEELKSISKIKEKTIILGGAKVSTKLPLIENLLPKSSKVLIGGLICFTFLKAKGYNVGAAYVEEDKVPLALKLLKKYPNKIVLPVDFITKNKTVALQDIQNKDVFYDIGPLSTKLFIRNIKTSYVVWNGPLGYAEKKEYRASTETICDCLNKKEIKTLVCGGDTVSIIKKMTLDTAYYSTGGGASLEYLSGVKFNILKNLK